MYRTKITWKKETHQKRKSEQNRVVYTVTESTACSKGLLLLNWLHRVIAKGTRPDMTDTTCYKVNVYAYSSRSTPRSPHHRIYFHMLFFSLSSSSRLPFPHIQFQCDSFVYAERELEATERRMNANQYNEMRCQRVCCVLPRIDVIYHGRTHTNASCALKYGSSLSTRQYAHNI